MIKRYLLLFFILFQAFLTKGQGSSLLWEISGKDLVKPSYLFGTMHIKDKRVFNFSDSLMIKLKSCKTFAGELILDKSAVKGLQNDLLLPEGKELQTLMSKKEYELVKKTCKKHLGILSMMINKIKPIFTSAMLSESLLSSDMSESLDEYLQDEAKKNGLKLVGLETVQEQMSVLNELSIEEQANMLVEQVKNLDKEKKEMENMLEVYISQNLDSLYKFTNTPELSGEFGDAMIRDRNIKMATRIDKLIQSETAFIAIGAAHLPGKEGVIELLRKEGYILRPINKKVP